MVLMSLHGQRAEAQLAVADVITELQTTITSIQATISAGEAVIHTAKWIIDQTGFDELMLGEDWSEDIGQLNALVMEAEALSYDIGSLESLLNSTFSLEGAPDNTTAFQEQQREIRRYVYQGYTYAMRTQTMIRTALRTVTHVLRIYEQVSAIFGTVSGHQNLAQSQAKLVQLATESKVTVTAMQRAQSLERINEPLILESLDRINEATMADHPR
jgi:hypothetical protein